MKIVINYADSVYREAQRYNTKTALKVGGANRVIEFSRDSIDKEFLSNNSDILNLKRGGGYWLWKPYIIKKALDMCDDGDYIFYVDSGAYFINTMDFLIREMEKCNISLMSFSIPFKELQYSKRDILEFFNVWESRKELGDQRLAGFILLKKCDKTIRFINEFLEIATKDSLITDSPSLHQPEDVNFIENRHDQSIFSLLCKKYNIPDFRDPSEYGIYPILYHTKSTWLNDYKPSMDSDYPQILALHRKKKVNLLVRLDAYLRRNIDIETYIRFSKYFNNFKKTLRKFLK